MMKTAWIIDAPGTKFIANQKLPMEGAWGPYRTEAALARAIMVLGLEPSRLGDVRDKPFGWEKILNRFYRMSQSRVARRYRSHKVGYSRKA